MAELRRRHGYRPFLYPAVVCLVVANTINARTDIGAIVAAVNLVMPVPTTLTIIAIAVAIMTFQILASYRRVASIFKWLTLTLFAYIGAEKIAPRPSIQSAKSMTDRGRSIFDFVCAPAQLHRGSVRRVTGPIPAGR